MYSIYSIVSSALKKLALMPSSKSWLKYAMSSDKDATWASGPHQEFNYRAIPSLLYSCIAKGISLLFNGPLCFTIPYTASAIFLGPEFPSIIGGLFGLLIVTIAIKNKILIWAGVLIPTRALVIPKFFNAYGLRMHICIGRIFDSEFFTDST